jgi:C_GCAxxG_C_C family probable redox protein
VTEAIEEMDEDTVSERFSEGFACSQVCLETLSDEIGLDRQTARKVASLFGGGAGCGEMCGAVAGCIMALGMKHGLCRANDHEQRERGMEKVAELKQRMDAEFGSIVCRQILGHDPSTPEGRKAVQEAGYFETLCPRVVCRAIDITRSLL